MKSHLSGMPDVQLGLNDRVPIEGSLQSEKGKVINLDALQY